MAVFFKAADVVAAAVEMEKRGQVFYRDKARKVADPAVKAFFESLAAEEMRHEQLFTAMVARVGQAELPAWSTQEEFSTYLKALLDSHALFTPAPASVGEGLEEAVRAAMELEKDSMLFFQEMLALVPAGEQERVRDCIEEERRHLRQLAAMLKG
uniref:Rubrerythrin n=1 Tax=Fundidesulfovibrio putealis TaxID=270496 RepID=A0A7C4AFV7_9BACT